MLARGRAASRAFDCGSVACALQRIRAIRCYCRAMAAQRIHVLVIDDDAAIREMLALALAEAGHVVAVSDGAGLDRVDGIDVALVDVRLGNTTARELVANVPGLGAIPLILMTAGADVGEPSDALPALRAVISKPFDLDVVEAAIRAAARRDSGVELSPIAS